MNLAMSGIDHTTTDIEQRECFAMTEDNQIRLLEYGKDHPEILGMAVLSTCNRMELYLSLKENSALTPEQVLKDNGFVLPEIHNSKTQKSVYNHLSRLACGVYSRIYGEDQILSQVKRAIAFSRSLGASDSALEVLFRTAVTAAKKVKTVMHYSGLTEAASSAVAKLIQEHASGKKVLVIGNGEIGRLNASGLQKAGYDVYMTLRQYRYGMAVIPDGVKAVSYTSRYDVIENVDTVVSATSSQHYTVTMNELEKVSRIPSLMIDLAVPRDIEPNVGRLSGTMLLNIDDICDNGTMEEQRMEYDAQLEPILQEGWEALINWERRSARYKCMSTKTHFPFFVDVTGKTALIIGGGKIASRRAISLSKFTFDIVVVAPEITHEIQSLVECGRLKHIKREFIDDDINGAFFVIAATDNRAVNHRVAVLARHQGIYASIADCRDECSVFFPGLINNEDVTAAVCGDGTSPHKTASAAKKIREVLE